MGDWNKYMIRSLDLGKIERMMLYDARHEHQFSRFCIKEAMVNARTAQQPLTSSQIEAQEALLEDL
jgi:hypothetical protein